LHLSQFTCVEEVHRFNLERSRARVLVLVGRIWFSGTIGLPSMIFLFAPSAENS
jgi:hypothetical protein